MSTRQLFAAILFLGFFAFSIRVPMDPDMWWHLRTGQYVLEEGVPYEDPPFSFTTDGQEWIAHEWLTDIIMYWIQQGAGFAGLAIFFALIIMLTFMFLYWASDGQPYVAGLAAFWGIAASLPFLNSRPQMFNIFFGALFILIIEKVRKKEWSSAWLWSIPILTIVWANMHGGYLLGIVIMGVYVVGEFCQYYFEIQRKPDEHFAMAEILQLAGIGVLSTLAALLNPYGVKMWTYAITTTLTSEAMREVITEWKSPDFHIWIFWVFGFMVMASWILMVYSPRQATLTDILFIVGTSFAGFQSVRNIPLFAMAAVPILARHAAGIIGQTSWGQSILTPARGQRPHSRAGMLNWVVVVLVFIGVGLVALQEISDIDEMHAEGFPIEAVDWLKENQLDDARVFNDYDWGGYLIWAGIPTYIDGRADLFGDEFIYYYMQTYTRQRNWREPLDEYDVDLILTRTNGHLPVLIDASQEWESIYEDDLARIYQRIGE